MEAWLVVWLVVGLVTTAALLVMLGFLVRHVILLGRTAGRMQEEIQPIADEVVAAAQMVVENGGESLDEASRLSDHRRVGAAHPERRLDDVLEIE